PEMFGYELVKKLKNSDATAYIRIIMLSSLDHPTEIANGLIAGADDYITKPFIPKILLARVRAQLRTKLLINQLLKKRKP
ncbi:MAG: response regulator, partial [Candidatus Scalindua sp.]|nr:response regulator [Candidatus Scalindua sp.]